MGVASEGPIQVRPLELGAIDQGDRHAEAVVEQVPDLPRRVARHAVADDQHGLRLGERAEARAAQVDAARGEARGERVDERPVLRLPGGEQVADLPGAVALEPQGDDHRAVVEAPGAVRGLGGERPGRHPGEDAGAEQALERPGRVVAGPLEGPGDRVARRLGGLRRAASPVPPRRPPRRRDPPRRPRHRARPTAGRRRAAGSRPRRRRRSCPRSRCGARTGPRSGVSGAGVRG